MRALKLVEAQYLPDTAELLAEGGDARIALDSGRNEYGCAAYPDAGLAEFGSSTASTISEAGFRAADALRGKLAVNPDGAACDREFRRIRAEFSQLCGLEGHDILFAASGTDVHLLAAQLTGPDIVLMADGSETGRGVPAALSGRHFSSSSAYCVKHAEGGALGQDTLPELSSVAVRSDAGLPRDSRDVDEEFAIQVASCAAKGKKALLVLADVSKTGMIVPSLSCALGLKERFPDSLEILVDACQFRMAPVTLSAYLEKGFMVALTGSKFLTGPTFSGALVVPKAIVWQKAPKGLSAYSSRYEWPEGRRNGFSGSGANFGLLLRWEAALAELRAFRRVPEIEVERFLERFAKAIRGKLESDPHFDPLPVPDIDRSALLSTSSWDRIQTIFPFRLRKGGVFQGKEEARRVHAMLKADLSAVSGHGAVALRCSLGQPVASGALRICSSARLVTEGVGNGDKVIERALLTLDKVALILDLPSLQSPKRL